MHATENNPLLVNSLLASQALTQTHQATTAAHKMQTHWQFWFFKRAASSAAYTAASILSNEPKLVEQSYREQLKSLGKIPSIEHFFNYYVFLKKPTEMPRDIDLFFFRNNEVPMWEVSHLRFD